MKALIIDDSKTARMMLIRIFKELGGWEIFEAGNGREALDRLKETGPVDLACVDWNMPEMNGYEFVKAVRKEQDHKAMWIMMVTTETEMQQMVKAMAAGANEYMMKPFTKEGILAKMQLMGFQV